MMKRLFFAFEILAPWDDPPSKKWIDPVMRHLTLAFLGNIEASPLLEHLLLVPKPPFNVGQCGLFDKLKFLPEHHARLVSFHAEFGERLPLFQTYVLELWNWLNGLGMTTTEKRAWLPHVTIARMPFSFAEWRKHFTPLPLAFHKLHLYESTPGSHYTPIWTQSLPPPFEEIEHTADIAFKVLGESPQALCLNAFTALCFQFPKLTPFRPILKGESEEAVIYALNQSLALADAKLGCPFKAVSHHGSFEKNSTNLISWEMIVDV